MIQEIQNDYEQRNNMISSCVNPKSSVENSPECIFLIMNYSSGTNYYSEESNKINYYVEGDCERVQENLKKPLSNHDEEFKESLLELANKKGSSALIDIICSICKDYSLNEEEIRNRYIGYRTFRK